MQHLGPGEYLDGQAVLASIHIHELQARNIARRTVGNAVQYELQKVASRQARLDAHANVKSTVVGADSAVGRDVGQLQNRIGGGRRRIDGWRLSCGRWGRRALGHWHAIERRQVERLCRPTWRGGCSEYTVLPLASVYL